MTPKDPGQAQALTNIIDMIVSNFDYAVSSTGYYEPGANPVLHRHWTKLAERFGSDEMKRKRLSQSAVETFLHGILYYLDNSDDIRLQARTPSGEWLSINELTDGEAYGDFMDWLRAQSKYGCITLDLIDVDSEPP